MVKYIFITGGVASGIGKGTIASSIGLLLQHRGLRVSAIKIDPYLNVDAGNMSPHEHGEVYVLADGTECDLDLGNYERFLGIELTNEHSITTGGVYASVIAKERAGEYLGHTVQIVPHITDNITQRIERAARVHVTDGEGNSGTPDVVIVELGGTVGDMESEPFYYAISALQTRLRNDICVIHVGLLITNNGEHKTKPIQHSLQAIRSRGVFPDVLCVRCDVIGEPPGIRDKLALPNIIFSGRVDNIYQVPGLLESQSITDIIDKRIGPLHLISPFQINLNPPIGKRTVNVNIIAKYTAGPDTYLSLTRAIEHASFAVGISVNITFVNAETCEDAIENADGVIIPGGFGDRGIEGKIKAITTAKRLGIPVLGICLGMQLLAIEQARTQHPDANSTEFNPQTSYVVVNKLDNGEMRLGNQPMIMSNDIRKLLGYPISLEPIYERHRHRYHVTLMDNVVAYSIGNRIPEVTLYPNKESKGKTLSSNWRAIGVQFHPEYKSRNNQPHPMFMTFLKRINQ